MVEADGYLNEGLMQCGGHVRLALMVVIPRGHGIGEGLEAVMPLLRGLQQHLYTSRTDGERSPQYSMLASSLGIGQCSRSGLWRHLWPAVLQQDAEPLERLLLLAAVAHVLRGHTENGGEKELETRLSERLDPPIRRIEARLELSLLCSLSLLSIPRIFQVFQVEVEWPLTCRARHQGWSSSLQAGARMAGHTLASRPTVMARFSSCSKAATYAWSEIVGERGVQGGCAPGWG